MSPLGQGRRLALVDFDTITITMYNNHTTTTTTTTTTTNNNNNNNNNHHHHNNHNNNNNDISNHDNKKNLGRGRRLAPVDLGRQHGGEKRQPGAVEERGDAAALWGCSIVHYSTVYFNIVYHSIL